MTNATFLIRLRASHNSDESIILPSVETLLEFLRHALDHAMFR